MTVDEQPRLGPQPTARRVHDAWIVFGASFLTLLGAAGFRSAPSVPIDPLREEFGWDRATVGLAVSINVLLFGFIGPFAAALQAPGAHGRGRQPGRVDDLLRAGLGGDGSAHDRAVRPDLRPRAGPARVRLGLRRPSRRRRPRGLGRGRAFAISGSYRSSFVVAGTACVIAAVAVVKIDRRPVGWGPVPAAAV